MKTIILFLLSSTLAFSMQADEYKSNVKIERAAKKAFRDYYSPTTSSERDDIRYVVNTLGISSLLKIAKSKSSIKKAGDRVDHVHPLQFLICIFSDEKTKASFHAVQARGWIWDEFSANLTNSLKGEGDSGKLTPAIINDFARQVEIDPSLIYPAIESGQWYEFIRILTENIPRKTPNDRYDI